MHRFVILRHDCPAGYERPTHWDFMLERGESLRTWALATAPADGETTTAESLPDHRPAYLDYEGPVSGDRGTVARFDAGGYEVERESDAELVVRLHGTKLAGRATLVRQADAPHCWRFSFSSERPATSGASGDDSREGS